MTRRILRSLPLVGVLLLVVLGSMTASAAVATDAGTEYNGNASESDQAIAVQYTISPDGGDINNMTVAFGGTAQTFVQSDSFSFTVSPGGSDIDVESRGENTFFIPEMGSNEEVTFTFEVYPKTIKQEQIDAVSVRMDYIQNGQELSDSETITADMASSPWFELQSAAETIDRQQSQIQQTSVVGEITDWALIGSVIVGVAGAVFGTYSWRRRRREREELRREHASNLESVAERVSQESAKTLLYEEAEDVRENLEDTGHDDW